LLDEFQEIGVIGNGRGIEGAIRHAAQETQNLSLIFSGSNPHLLKTMFEDERRPLHKLCRKLTLDRIQEDHYKKHLSKAFKPLWKEELNLALFEKIMELTERHPYYINYLCDELCSQYDALPTPKDIEKYWELVVEEERSDLIKDFSSLSDNQRTLMIYIANNGGKNLLSNDVSQKTMVPSSSISRALSALIEKDYIKKSEHNYRLIVPLYNQLLAQKI
jgi:DNA-binding MarR family transcriptional regulator